MSQECSKCGTDMDIDDDLDWNEKEKKHFIVRIFECVNCGSKGVIHINE